MELFIILMVYFCLFVWACLLYGKFKNKSPYAKGMLIMVIVAVIIACIYTLVTR